MESVTCLSSCSVVLRYLVSGAGAIHGEFPLRPNCSMIGKIPPKGVSLSDFICTFAMSFGDFAILLFAALR